MKNRSSLFLAAAALFSLASCASDDGGDGCSMKGDWRVKSADLSSDRVDSTILALSKTMALGRKYSFKADSVTILSGNVSEGNYVGVYAVDAVNNLLIIDAVSSNGAPFKDSLRITSCTGSEVGLSKRIPTDTTKEVLMKTVFTIEKTD